MSYERKIAIVTGGGQGIGAAISEALLITGCIVIVADIDYQASNDLCASLGEKNKCNILPIELDLASNKSIHGLVDFVVGEYGYIDYIVNSARPMIPRKSFPYSVDDMDYSHKVMLEGPALLIAKALPHMKSSRSPAIVNISSTNSFLSSMQSLSYHVYKAALDQLTRHLSYELGGKGVRVNSVSPGLVHKPNNKYSKNESRIRNSIVPLKYIPTESDISNMVIFLLSEKSKAITGQVIIMDGGMTNVDQHNCAHILLSTEE